MYKKEFDEVIKKKNYEIDLMLAESSEGIKTIGSFLKLKDQIEWILFNRVSEMLIEANRTQILRALVALENLESFVKVNCPNESDKTHWLQFIQQMSDRLKKNCDFGKETIQKMKEIENKIAS